MPTAVDDATQDTGEDTNGAAKKAEKPARDRVTANVVFCTTDNIDDIDPMDAQWQGVGEYDVVGNGGAARGAQAGARGPEQRAAEGGGARLRDDPLLLRAQAVVPAAGGAARQAL